VLVEVRVLAHLLRGRVEAVFEQPPNEGVVAGASSVRPVFTIEVLVHQKPREGEKPQRDGAAVDAPAGAPLDDAGGLVEVGRQVEVALVGARRHRPREAEVAFQKGFERDVSSDLFPRVPQPEASLDARAVQLDGYEQERRPPLGVAALALAPV